MHALNNRLSACLRANGDKCRQFIHTFPIGRLNYGASRGGVKQLTMSLADDWGVHGITVNCLAPGWFKTKQNAVMYENQEWLEYLCDRIPLKRPGQPQDLEGAVVFLASDASAYITGQTLLVDGGISTGATRALPKKR